MDILGIEISETATAWTAIAGILTSIGTTWKMFSTMRQNKKLKNGEIRKSKIENVDLVNNIYKEAFEHAEMLFNYQKKHFTFYIDYCENNIEDFIKFIANNKKQKDENSNSSRT